MSKKENHLVEQEAQENLKQTDTQVENRTSRLQALSLNRRTKVSLTLLLAFLLIGGGYVVLKSKLGPAPVVYSQSQAQVRITSLGFLPGTISLKAGEPLTWVNNDSKPHQVAGDPYPLNDSIPGLETTTVLEPGDTLTYTFETPGVYTYHDELNHLRFKGTVIVE